MFPSKAQVLLHIIYGDGQQRGVETEEVCHCGSREVLHRGEGDEPDWEDGIPSKGQEHGQVRA